MMVRAGTEKGEEGGRLLVSPRGVSPRKVTASSVGPLRAPEPWNQAVDLQHSAAILHSGRVWGSVRFSAS